MAIWKKSRGAIFSFFIHLICKISSYETLSPSKWQYMSWIRAAKFSYLLVKRLYSSFWRSALPPRLRFHHHSCMLVVSILNLIKPYWWLEKFIRELFTLFLVNFHQWRFSRWSDLRGFTRSNIKQAKNVLFFIHRFQLKTWQACKHVLTKNSVLYVLLAIFIIAIIESSPYYMHPH